MEETVEEQIKEAKQEPAETGEQNPLVAMVRKVLLVGIGAMAMTQEEAEKFVGRLVERGEIAEKDGRRLIHDLMDKRKKETRRAEVELDTQIEGILSRMNVPTKSDLEALGAKIAELSKKVDELKKG